MESTPNASPDSHDAMEQLLAALLTVDPGAALVGRTALMAQLRCSDETVLIIHFSKIAEQLEAALETTAEAKDAKHIVRAEISNAAELLERYIKRFGLNERGGYAWSATEGPSKIFGPSLPLLKVAHNRLQKGPIDLGAAASEREQQTHLAQTFLTPLLARPIPISIGITALSIVMFALQMYWGNGDAFRSGIAMGAGIRDRVLEGEVWRLLAPMLLHGNLFHLAMNMLALYSFGTFLERLLGWRRFLLLYVASGLGGSIASTLRPETVVSVGASGGIWGLMIAGAALVTLPRGRLPALIVASQRSRAWTPVAINLLYSLRGGIDMLAHLGGGLIGGLLVASGVLLIGIPNAESSNDTKRPPLREGPLMTFVGAGSGVVLLLSIVVAMWVGKPWSLNAPPSSTTVALGSFATIDLPQLPSHPVGNTNEVFLFGRLDENPIAVVVTFSEPFSADEGANEVLSTLASELENETSQDGARAYEKVEVRETADQSYVFGERRRNDIDLARTYLFIHQQRFVRVTVLISNDASEAWQAEADRIPFTLKARPLQTP